MKRGHPVVDLGQPVVNLRSTCGQPVVDLWSTCGQPVINLGWKTGVNQHRQTFSMYAQAVYVSTKLSPTTRGLHSSTSQLNLSRLCH
jgi:hypothetical protein